VGKNSTGSSQNLLAASKHRTSLPTLGSGPHSESGLRIVIEQRISTSKVATEGNGSTMTTERPKGGKRHVGEGKIAFGTVHVDLAAFAGKGKLTRRFLLEGSKTNATVKVGSARSHDVELIIAVDR
jgi:hypothetical protein